MKANRLPYIATCPSTACSQCAIGGSVGKAVPSHP